MLAIQEYISLFPNIEKANKHLTENLYIRIKKESLLVPESIPSGQSCDETVYLYNYHPTKSPRDNSIVEECNGLILNTDAEIVSMLFPRIYSIHEKHAPEMEWERARAELQADGVLVVVFNYKDKWHIQTRTSVRAVESMKVHNISICTGAISILDAMFEDKKGPFYPFEKCDEKNFCYVFELVSPYNKYITPYYDQNLILLAVFDKKRLIEMSDEWVNQFQRNYCDGWMFARPRAYGVKTAKDVLELTGYMEAEQKGFIIVDQMSNRVKIKNPVYRALEKMINSKGEASPEVYAKIALSGYAAEITHNYAEYAYLLGMFTSSITSITEAATHAWEEHYGQYYGQHGHRSDYYKKEFMMRIDHLPKMFKTILFRMWQRKISTIKEGVGEMRSKTLAMATKKGYGNLFTEEIKRLKGAMQRR